MDRYAHQRIITEHEITNKFLCVHDDTFGRAFENEDSIIDYLSDIDRTRKIISHDIEVLSKGEDGDINVFLLTITSIERIDSVSELIYIDSNLENLINVKYYTIEPVDWNSIDRGNSNG